MATISEIAPDLFRISTFVPEFNLQFNQFLVRVEKEKGAGVFVGTPR